MTDSVASLRGATKRYGAHVALDALDLALEPGRVTALLGPNGAGKTTTVRLLLGLAHADAGEVRVFDGDPRHAATRARVGVMLQVGRVPETLTVREHVNLFRAYYPNPLPYDAVIEAAGLAGLDRRLYGKLSGGEKQRVLFALALCGGPDLLVLDEPTVGLDVDARRVLWAHIRALRERGKAVLLTTHYLDEADALADRIVVIARGRIVADGSPSEVKARVASRKIRCVTDLSLLEIRALAGVDSARMNGDRVEITTSHAEPVVRTLLDRDATLTQLEVSGAALEDAFLEVTKMPDHSHNPASVKSVTSVAESP